jgi:sec-independent protein translocase protein TatB
VFGIGPEKVALLGLIALLVLGPRRLPDVARGAGRAVGEARRLVRGLQAEMEVVSGEPGNALSEVVETLRESGGQLRQGLGSVFDSADPSLGTASSAPSSIAEDHPGRTAPAPDDPGLN